MARQEVVKIIGEGHGLPRLRYGRRPNGHFLLNRPGHVAHGGRISNLPKPGMEVLAAVQGARVSVHRPLALLVGEAVAYADLHREDGQALHV
jgi:hypothetical protein